MKLASRGVDGWSSDEREEIMVGDRWMRVRRRVRRRSKRTLVITLVTLLVVAGVGYGLYLWLSRPTGLAALANPAVVAPGGFRASTAADRTVTVGLEIRNITDVQLSVINARVVAPKGLSPVGLSLASPGEGNRGFVLDGPLPSMAPVTLGTTGTDRNGVLIARFKVDCAALPKANGPTGEHIFVTVQLASDQREDELVPPVIDGVPWLTATARRACVNPITTTSPAPPLPALTGGTARP